MEGGSGNKGNMLPILSTFQVLLSSKTNIVIHDKLAIVRDAKINFTSLDE